MPKRSPRDLEESLLADDTVADEDWADANEQQWPRQEAQVGSDAHGQRLDVFLVSMAPDFSRSYLKTLVESGHVQVAGQVANSASRKVLAGQSVVLELKPTPQSQAFSPEQMDIPIVFEDEHLLVVNKPAGMVVHPAAGNWTGTLMNGLLAHHAGAMDLPRAGIVHRLDKDTSGLMVVGKTRVRMAVVASGKEAKTDVQCLLTGEVEGLTQAISGVRCTLHTGRTHQIRVHLSHRKYPLVADAIYGGQPALGMARQALHATRLALVHPVTNVEMVWEAPLPEDMGQAWAELAKSPQLPIRGA